MSKLRKTPRRSCVGRPANKFTYKDDKWSIEELENLLKALKRHGKYNIEAIQTYIPSRKSHEVSHKIRTLSSKAKTSYIKKFESVVKEDAPIEEFLKVLYSITDNENDYSTLLGQVWDMMGFLEPHLKPSIIKKIPDFGILYRYVGSILQNHTPPPLTSIEASVIMDCFNCLAVEVLNLNSENQIDFITKQWNVLSKFLIQEPTSDQVEDELEGLSKPLKKKKSVVVETNDSVSKFKIELQNRKLSSLNPLLIPARLLNPSRKVERRIINFNEFDDNRSIGKYSSNVNGNSQQIKKGGDSIEMNGDIKSKNENKAEECNDDNSRACYQTTINGNTLQREENDDCIITDVNVNFNEKVVEEIDTVAKDNIQSSEKVCENIHIKGLLLDDKLQENVIDVDKIDTVAKDNTQSSEKDCESIHIKGLTLDNELQENFIIDIEILPQSDSDDTHAGFSDQMDKDNSNVELKQIRSMVETSAKSPIPSTSFQSSNKRKSSSNISRKNKRKNYPIRHKESTVKQAKSNSLSSGEDEEIVSYV